MTSYRFIGNSSTPAPEFHPLVFHEILFSKLAHRSEDSNVIISHIGDELITLSLNDMRFLTGQLSVVLQSKGLKFGDTVLLASFSCSNELANVLIFAAAASLGIRIFIPIFLEPAEFDHWKVLTTFSHVIMPYHETLELKDHPREKDIVNRIKVKCEETGTGFLDSNEDFQTFQRINQRLNEKHWDDSDMQKLNTLKPDARVTPDTEMVIFTTSGTSGKSKLVVYSHESLAFCCQSWQQSGLFARDQFGNPGFSPLFTHTIGIRTFINCLWSGNPFCVVVTDWFLLRPAVVRYLLLKMNPGHIIGGPAFFHTMLELFRQYPELKTGIQKTLRACISIGAPYDPGVASKFKVATGISIMNGFGTTETLMISLNTPAEKQLSGSIIPEPKATNGFSAEPEVALDPRNLGEPLPGVTLRLEQTGEGNLYELAVKSVFMSVRTIGETANAEYLETGDLVTYEEDTSNILYYGRKSGDFIKDDYGVKIPLNALKEYYGKLYEMADWIEWIPLENIPGLAALIFINSPDTTSLKLMSLQKETGALIKSLNERLKGTIEPFEYMHRHLGRFTLLNSEVPLTRKGTVSKDQIYKIYEVNIAELRNPFVYSKTIETTETGEKSNLHKFSNPYLAELLEALRMDREYVKGEGDYLFYRKGSSLQRVTDFVGGFGAGLLGHDHPKIREAAVNFLQSGFPALNNQGSMYHYPSLLAKELNRLFSENTGRYFKVLFGNSGSEATEMAIHHAYFEWRKKLEKLRDEQFQLYGSIPGLPLAETWDKNLKLMDEVTPCFIVVNNCFHGYTSGARSLLNPKEPRRLFNSLLKPQPLHVTDTHPDWQEQIEGYISEHTLELQVFQLSDGKYGTVALKFSSIIASIIEPVRGEGGIHVINPLFADYMAAQDFPLISDEIQCGLGRTGSFPAYKKASYYLLGKSLGGGLEKISAVLIDDNRFKPLFSKYYNSTFANGELAAAVALSTLKVIEEERITATAKASGNRFLGLLHETADKHPDIIESIEGEGLMIGIHFNPKLRESNIFFRILVEHELLGYFFAGWFLHTHHIRVLPSLSKPNTLRLEPSYLLPEPEMARLCEALDELCRLCSAKQMYKLFRFLMNDDIYTDRKQPIFEGTFPQQLELPAPGAVKAGFIGNFTISHRELQVLEPDFRQASDTGLRILYDRLQVLMQGKSIKILASNMLNGKVHFTFYLLPFDTTHLEVISRWGKKRYYISKIQDAVQLLWEEGSQCIGLGAHTSIITGNGLNLAERGNSRIITGNSLTVGSCLYHLNNYLGFDGLKCLRKMTIAVVGASGNIGTGFVECLNDPAYAGQNLILIGNNEKRLQRLKRVLSSNHSGVSVTTDLFELKKADVIICCVNTNDPVIFTHHLQDEKPVYIIDISVPGAVSEDVRTLSNVTECMDASSVYVPGNPDLLISSHTPVGKIFCCAGEVLLQAIYRLNLPMKGHIQKETVLKLVELAEEEAFFKQVAHEATV